MKLVEEEEEEEEPPPLWGRSTSHAKYKDERVWRFTADEEEVIPGTVEDESTVAFEDGTRWEEKKKQVSYGKMALAGLGGAVVGGVAGYVIQKKFFSKAAKKVPGDYIIILDRSSAMAEMEGPHSHGKARSAMESLPPEEIEEMKAQFAQFDANGDGTMDPEEVAQLLMSLDPEAWTEESAAALLEAMDKNGDGNVDIGEFVDWVFETGGIESLQR